MVKSKDDTDPAPADAAEPAPEPVAEPEPPPPDAPVMDVPVEKGYDPRADLLAVLDDTVTALDMIAGRITGLEGPMKGLVQRQRQRLDRVRAII